jgi:hypothetical protein
MTPQEQQLLQDLTDRINHTSLTEKDPEAEQFIFQQLGRNSDSLYIMAQTILVQQYALDQAKKQLEDARQQLDQIRQQSQQSPQQPAKHGSFLGNLLGLNDAPPPPPPPSQQYNQPQYAPVPNYPQQPPYSQPQYGQPQYAQPGYGTPSYAQPSQGSGFLRSAMTTATGVAAGALAFEGIESLMHGFGEHAGYGGGSGLGGFGGGEREEIVNNYYGDSGSSLGERAEHSGISPDIEDRRDQSNFADTSTDTDNSGSMDDYGTDDSSSDAGSDDSSDYGSDDNS